MTLEFPTTAAVAPAFTAGPPLSVATVICNRYLLADPTQTPDTVFAGYVKKVDVDAGVVKLPTLLMA